MSVKAGEVFAGRFKILREIGSGGNGEVFEVLDDKFGTRRALKVLIAHRQRDVKACERFVRESRAAASIDSEHVVRIYDYGVNEDGTPWLLMELLRGRTLERHVCELGPLSLSDAKRLTLHLGHALSAAHAMNIVHLDLKPANLFLASVQRAEATLLELKVLDFGLSHTIQVGRTNVQMTTQAGTLVWMPPEQHNPKAELRKTADVWPLGLIAFWMLTGRHFWKAMEGDEENVDNLALMLEVAQGVSVSASSRAQQLGVLERLPDGFDEWFAHCMEKDATRRWSDGSAATKALQDILARASVAPSNQLQNVSASRQAKPPSPPAVAVNAGNLPRSVAPNGVETSSYITNLPSSVLETLVSVPDAPNNIAEDLTGHSSVTKAVAENLSPFVTPAKLSQSTTAPQTTNFETRRGLGIKAGIVLGLGVLGLAASAVFMLTNWQPARVVQGDGVQNHSRAVPPRHSALAPTTGIRDASVVDVTEPMRHSEHEARVVDGCVQLSGGTFMMGSAADDGHDDERPRHSVTVASFCIDRTEVTVSAYRACVDAGSCRIPVPYDSHMQPWHVFCNWGRPGAEGHPVNCVTAAQAERFCSWRYPGVGSLPTEDQWEFAARGVSGRVFPWGNSPSPSPQNTNLCGVECAAYARQQGFTVGGRSNWFDPWGTTAPVVDLPSAGDTPEGLVGMLGNVWEWTRTSYGRYTSQAGTSTTYASVQRGYRVIRGVGYGTSDASSAMRRWVDISLSNREVGFRCVRGEQVRPRPPQRQSSDQGHPRLPADDLSDLGL